MPAPSDVGTAPQWPFKATPTRKFFTWSGSRPQFQPPSIAISNPDGWQQRETMTTPEQKSTITMWFTFGQSHVHSCNGVTLDKDIVIEVTAEDPAERMFELFGPKWSMSYTNKPDMSYYPRGIYKLP